MTRLSRVRTHFQEVARLVDGEYEEYFAGGLPHPAVRRAAGRHRYTLVRPPGDAAPVPSLLVPFTNPKRVQIHIRPEHWLARALKRLGFIQEVVTGDAALDARFLLSAIPQGTLKEILARDRARRLLRDAGNVRVRVVPVSGLAPAGSALRYASLPRGMDILRLRASWGLPSADKLAALFGLAEEILAVLDPAEAYEEADRETLLARVRQRGTVVHLPGTELPLWDVRHERRDAARALGRLGGEGVARALVDALEDEDPGLASAAADGLASIRDPAAVGPLAGLLGRRSADGDAGTVAEHAAQALRALGRGELVDAFESTLAGDPEGLRGLGLAGKERDGIVYALIQVLESGELGIRPHTARALGLLGAHAALPALRRASRAAGMRTRLTEAAREAIQALEARASLPRPATAGGGERTLPRPAEAPSRRSDLPRPASPEAPEP